MTEKYSICATRSRTDIDCILDNEQCQFSAELSRNPRTQRMEWKQNVIRTVMEVSRERCLELCEIQGTGPFGGTRCQAATHFGAESFPFRCFCTCVFVFLYLYVCLSIYLFGAGSFLFRGSCMLFSSCNNRRPCKDCITGSHQTHCTCSINYASVSDNVLRHVDNSRIVRGVFPAANELECKRLCLQNGLCKVRKRQLISELYK